ncbi:glucosaminidase domain-containing protein [Paenibacillus sp. strain BS8-2]
MAKMTRDQFFAAIAPSVELVRMQGSLMFPSVRMAQSLLESGGEIHDWNNLGGIKVGSGITNAYWHGGAVIKGTWEYLDGRTITTKTAFRAYKTLYHFYKDLDLLLEAPRYERVRSAGTPERQAAMLQACGYATDPAYPTKLMAIIQQYGLKKYDVPAAPPIVTRDFDGAVIVPVTWLGAVISTGYLFEGVTWVPARKVAETLGAKVGWTGTAVTVNGTELISRLSISTGYVKVRDLAMLLSIEIKWEPQARVVMLGEASP